MSEIATVGLDLARNVFQAQGADASERAVLCKKLSRTGRNRPLRATTGMAGRFNRLLA